jgi:hypothetical protein
MIGRSVVHELDALDLATIWPLSGQSILAPIHSTTSWRSISKKAGAAD